MNGNYFPNPTFPTNKQVSEISPPGNISVESQLPMEQSLIENILRLNKGKKIKAYVSYPDSSAWQNKVYDGIIEQAGRDHLILRDTNNGSWYLIRMIYLNYVEFEEKINYQNPYV
ncbi:MAG: spore coat protein GerQ [Bacilli bacterium]|nr:spore coat protein GerQ [Bacilli bacterium]